MGLSAPDWPMIRQIRKGGALNSRPPSTVRAECKRSNARAGSGELEFRIRRILVTPFVLIVFALSLPLPAVALESYVAQVPTLSVAPRLSGSIDDTWSQAAKIELAYDFTYQQKSKIPTTAYVAIYDHNLFVAFDVYQDSAPVSVAQTDGPAVLNDDYVGVYLFPEGSSGFQYGFFANANGARYQFSSENSLYAPQWIAYANRETHRFEVTMRVPMAAIRKSSSTKWRAQFVYYSTSTNSLTVWAHSRAQSSPTDSAFAGILDGLNAAASSRTWPKARFQPYVLGELASASYGGNTSRVGVDLAIPVTRTASFVAALHPDYSNVEVDQQTIAPNAFPYQYVEVRPFFTQSAANFNYHANCLACPYTLYTPAIPTFAQGFAFEGSADKYSFGTFVTLSNGRTDQGQSLNYIDSSTNRSIDVSLQRVGVDSSVYHDDTTTISAGYTNQHSHLFVYGNVGNDDSSSNPTGADNHYVESGVGFSDATSTAMVSYLHIGEYFSPIDGYVAQTDISGYEAYASKIWTLSSAATIHDISASEYYARFWNAQGQLNQTDEIGEVAFDFKNFVTARLQSGAVAVQTVDGLFLPFDSNGFTLGYKMATSTPIYVQYTGGAYYHGRLDAWSYLATMPVTKRIRITLEADENRYGSSQDPSGVQWLERAAFDWELSHQTSIVLGVRRIIGLTVPNSFERPPFPFVNASNISAALHFLTAKNEIYFAYGDPNAQSTAPTLILKWIRYVGAEKGT